MLPAQAPSAGRGDATAHRGAQGGAAAFYAAARVAEARSCGSEARHYEALAARIGQLEARFTAQAEARVILCELFGNALLYFGGFAVASYYFVYVKK